MRKAVRAIVIKNGMLLVMHRNKFGQEYYTLIGGGIDFGETAEQALHREVREETGLTIHSLRLVFVEEAGDPFGMQYIYWCESDSGEVALPAESEEAKIHALGKNLYTPMWLPLKELPNKPFLSEGLKKSLLSAIENGFPEQPITISSK